MGVMKYTMIFLILLSSSMAFAESIPTRVLENNVAKVTLSLHARLEAEPISQPNEIRVEVACKSGKQKKKMATVSVCSADLQDTKDIAIDSKAVKFFHFEWDGPRSSNNSKGLLYCNVKDRVKDQMALSDFCGSVKK